MLPNFVLGPVISSRADGTSVGFMKVVGVPASQVNEASREHAVMCIAQI